AQTQISLSRISPTTLTASLGGSVHPRPSLPPPKSTTTPLHIFSPSASAQILLCSLLHLTRPW
ncbi:hypothetical protein PanWU01x14_192540, partial [Parasponia andersonii]